MKRHLVPTYFAELRFRITTHNFCQNVMSTKKKKCFSLRFRDNTTRFSVGTFGDRSNFCLL